MGVKDTSEGSAERIAARFAYQPPVEEMTGVRTFVSEKPAKGIQAPSGDSTNHSPGESPKSDRERAKPQRTDTKENLDRKTPGNWAFNTPGPSEPGHKIHVRSPGKPGEEYGHPYKDNVTPRRTNEDTDNVGDGAGAGGRKEAEVRVTRLPNYSERQWVQKGEAKRYYKKYYLKNRGKVKLRVKKRYQKTRHDPVFKRVKKLRNSPTYGKRFNRLPSGGYSRNRDRAEVLRNQKKLAEAEATVHIPYWHPDYGTGVVLDVHDQSVVIDSEELGLGTVPFFHFIHEAEFDTEEDIDALFAMADADFEEGMEPDPRSVVADFYRETYTPGYNESPGQGAQDLGAVSPYSTTLKYPDLEKNDVHPGEVMNNIREVDDNPGSAKVIPSGKGFVNKEASTQRTASAARVAAKMGEILRGLDSGVAERALDRTPKLVRSDPANIMFRFQVPGGKGERYIVRIKGVPPGKGVTNLTKMDLKLSCSCNFWRWQGPEHHAKVGEYLYGKPVGTASKPVIKDPPDKHRVCKHVAACLDVIKKWPALQPKGR